MMKTTIAEQLRDYIRKCGKSLNALANESNVDSGLLSRFMRGERTMTLNVVERIAVCLNLCLRIDDPRD